MNCGTCKYWGKPDETEEFRQCQVIRHDEKLYTRPRGERWEDDDPTEEELKFRSENIAVACDGSGYFGALRSRSDFGCILHVPKETP